MIRGRLEPDGRAVVSVEIGSQTFDAVIDTGLDGGVSVPLGLFQALNPAPDHMARYELADGTEVVMPVYRTVITLGGYDHSVELIISASDEVLLGVAAMKDYRLTIDYPAGVVTLERTRVS